MIKRILKSRFFHFVLMQIIRIYVFILFHTCKIDVKFDKEAEKFIRNNKQSIFVYWHSRILLFPKFLTPFGKFAAVISTHGDAQVLATMIENYGHKTVRGSSGKQSVQAMRGILELIKSKITFAITPDGPRGPRFKIKGAVTTLAAKFKLPVIPMCYSASNGIILRSWDRFVIPKPFISKIIIEVGKPVYFNEPDDRKLENIMFNQAKMLDKEMNLKVDY